MTADPLHPRLRGAGSCGRSRPLPKPREQSLCHLSAEAAEESNTFSQGQTLLRSGVTVESHAFLLCWMGPLRLLR